MLKLSVYEQVVSIWCSFTQISMWNDVAMSTWRNLLCLMTSASGCKAMVVWAYVLCTDLRIGIACAVWDGAWDVSFPAPDRWLALSKLTALTMCEVGTCILSTAVHKYSIFRLGKSEKMQTVPVKCLLNRQNLRAWKSAFKFFTDVHLIQPQWS